MRVLIVDDEPAICRALQIALTRAGYAVDTRETGEGALEMLRSEHVDALIVDLRIPDTRGDVLFEMAVSLQPHLARQTLFITGDGSARGMELVGACGCPMLIKPFDLKDLIAATGKLVVDARDVSA
ncbi:MAG TPA: response regulator [Gemmatimonadaceae bacterium]|nr:response regulator [Gemmatimonadaceae bacterium]